MLNKIFSGLLSTGPSRLQEYYRGVLRQAEGGAPTMDEARKDFHRMLRAQNPFTSV